MKGTGFSARYSIAVGAGQLPHVTNENGTTGTDTTDLEAYLERQQAETRKHREEILNKITPLQDRVARAEKSLIEARTNSVETSANNNQLEAEFCRQFAEMKQELGELGSTVDHKLIEYGCRLATMERGEHAGKRFRMREDEARRVAFNSARNLSRYPGTHFY